MQLTKSQLFLQKAFIDGQWKHANSGEITQIFNPATHDLLGTVPCMGATETKDAINAANCALPAWRALTAGERSLRLKEWFQLIKDNIDDLAQIMTAEQGKPLAEAKGEVNYAASFVEWFAEEAKRVYGDTIPEHQHNKRLLVIKQPVGVCAAITPWNFPAAMITRKVAPALAAGCTIIVKPAPQTPFTALALAFLAQQAGIPKGVFNVITGDANAIGHELCSSKIVRKLSFTGSTAVGAKLMEACAPNLKKLSLELGGNAPFIVFDDADLDVAVEGAMGAKFRNNGQTCVCVNRFYIHKNIYEKFALKLIEKVKQLQVGNGAKDNITTGPLINAAAVEKIQSHIKNAVSKGAKLELGGKPHQLGGFFHEPTVLSQVDASMLVTKEETFGPLAALIPFEDETDVIRQANDTDYGLAAYFFSQNLSRVWRVSEALEYGMVGVNTGLISNEVAPFGGIKASGLGREGSRYGIDEYLEMKYICMDVG